MLDLIDAERFTHEALKFLYYYDPYTYFHSVRVGLFSLFLASEFGVEDPKKTAVVGLLHDIGKICVPREILTSRTGLSEVEKREIRRHAEHGFDMIEMYDGRTGIAAAVRGHHESWDGSGYPDGLVGTEIPIDARIVSLADCFDAIAGIRTYRRPLHYDGFAVVVEEQAGTKFDPEIAAGFMSIRREAWGAIAGKAEDLFVDEGLREIVAQLVAKPSCRAWSGLRHASHQVLFDRS